MIALSKIKWISLIVCVIIVAVLVVKLYNDENKPVEVVDAINGYESYQVLEHELFIEYFEKNAVCLYEAEDGGITVAFLINIGTDEKNKYSAISYCGLETSNFAQNTLNSYFVFYSDKDYEYLCCVVKDKGIDSVKINNDKVQLHNFIYNNQDMQCWIYKNRIGNKISINY